MAASTAILGAIATTASASITTLQFAGMEGGLFGEPPGPALSVELKLDANASRVDSTLGPDGEATLSIYTSALQYLSGTFGDWTFQGIAEVYVLDGPSFWSNGQENMAQDYWIVRAPVSGPPVNGLNPTHLNLFYYSLPGAFVGSDVFPHVHPLESLNDWDHQFTLSFNDADGPAEFAGGRILDLEIPSASPVPEPTVASLCLMGFAVFALQKQRRRR